MQRGKNTPKIIWSLQTVHSERIGPVNGHKTQQIVVQRLEVPCGCETRFV